MEVAPEGQGVAWLLLSGAPPAHSGTRFRRPGPKQKRALGLDRGFPKRPGLGQIRRRRAGRRVVGTGVGGAAAGSSTSPPYNWASPRPGREDSRRSFGLGLGPEEDPKAGGPFPPPSRPGPRVARQDQGGPGVTFWLMGESGSCR